MLPRCQKVTDIVTCTGETPMLLCKHNRDPPLLYELWRDTAVMLYYEDSKIKNKQLKIENNTCHLIMADGSVVNYVSRSASLNCFIEQLITVCNYFPGYYSDAQPERVIVIDIDTKVELKDYCLSHPEYIVHSKLFAVSYNRDYSSATFFIDSEIFNINHQMLLDIALSMIGTIKYTMLVATGIWCPAHCALVEINGKGALICAPGGTGKSTCASRLPEPHRALGEDCALVVHSGDDFIAQAMPAWSLVISEHKKIENISFDCTATTKLSGIFFLEQSSIDAVELLSCSMALGYINSTFNDHMRWVLNHFTPEAVKMLRMNIFNLAEQLNATLPAYRLSATIDGNFWDVMAEVMQ
jgi:hypothetical protein